MNLEGKCVFVVKNQLQTQSFFKSLFSIKELFKKKSAVLMSEVLYLHQAFTDCVPD